MYEQHFRLKSNPFRSRVESREVFVGPEQMKVIAGLKKALAPSDAAVAVTGPVGVGKTTIVNRALEVAADKRVSARIGRMQLAADEVLELLLTEFGVSRQPNGTIQRFAAFKRLLQEWGASGTHACIVVEDAERVGNDALIELEALTSADAGDAGGARIVLLGQPTLTELLATPALARLRQRIRLRQTVRPFGAAEARGYLKHCIRMAGGEFEKVFEDGAADMLHRCSEGVPRVLNHLCEAALAAAADAGAPRVTPQLIRLLAREQFAIEPRPAAVSREPPAKPTAGPIRQSPGTRMPATPPRRPEPARQPAAAAVQPAPPARKDQVKAAPAPVAPPAPARVAPEARDADAIPELIQDTLPEIVALPSAGTPANELPDLSGPDGLDSIRADDIPILSPTPRDSRPSPAGSPSGTAANDDVPAWDRDPTLAQLKPDLAALEEALSGAREPGSGTAQPSPAVAGAASPQPAKDRRGKSFVLPELTLEKSIRQRQAEALEKLKQASPPDTHEQDHGLLKPAPQPATREPPRKPTVAPVAPKVEPPKAEAVKAARPGGDAANPAAPKVAAAGTAAPQAGLPQAAPEKAGNGLDLDSIAARLGKATSLENLDDRLAETLFGEEFSVAAAQVAALVEATEAADAGREGAAPAPAGPTLPAAEGSPAREAETTAAKPPATVELAPESGPEAAGPAVQITPETLPPAAEPPAAAPQPEPIEEQFGTSMTATLKALSAQQIRKAQREEEDEDEDEEKAAKRLFGLFRGSS